MGHGSYPNLSAPDRFRKGCSRRGSHALWSGRRETGFYERILRRAFEGRRLALGILFAFAAAIGFGFNQVFVRLATQRIPGPATAFFSVSTGAIIATVLALAFHLDDFKQLPVIAFAWYVALATLHHPIARVLNFTAISMIGASRAAPMGSFAPIVSAVLAIAILDERPGLLLYLGTLIVISGMTLVVTGGLQDRQTGPGVPSNNWGYLFALGAATGFGGVAVLVKHINAEFSPALVTVTFSLLIGTILLGVSTHRTVISAFVPSRRSHVPLTVLAGVCAGFGAICFFSALGRAPVTVVTPITFAAPLVTLSASRFFLKSLERINVRIVAGTFVTVAGVVLVVLGRA